MLGDVAGLTCVFLLSSSPAMGQGVPFSGASNTGSWSFDSPVPAGAVYGRCVSAGVLTVQEG